MHSRSILATKPIHCRDNHVIALQRRQNSNRNMVKMPHKRFLAQWQLQNWQWQQTMVSKFVGRHMDHAARSKASQRSLSVCGECTVHKRAHEAGGVCWPQNKAKYDYCNNEQQQQQQQNMIWYKYCKKKSEEWNQPPTAGVAILFHMYLWIFYFYYFYYIFFNFSTSNNSSIVATFTPSKNLTTNLLANTQKQRVCSQKCIYAFMPVYL